MGTLVKIKAATAADIHQHYELEEEVEALAKEGQSPQEFIDLLLESKLNADVVRFLAHALPKREAIWWACLASRSVLPETDKHEYHAALAAAEQWVMKPTEEHRRLAELKAEASKFKHAAGWAAVAAFWSSGSITAPEDPPIPAQPYLYAHAVSGSISLAATQGDSGKIEKHYSQMIEQGLDLARGGKGQGKAA